MTAKWRREVIGTDLPDLGIHQVMVNSMLEAYPELSGRTQRQAAMAIAERIMADLESGKLPPRLLLEFVQSVTPDADFTTYDVRVRLSTIEFTDGPVTVMGPATDYPGDSGVRVTLPEVALRMTVPGRVRPLVEEKTSDV